MSRPEELARRTFSTRLKPVDASVLLYYAWKYKKDRGEIVRALVSAYIDADEDLDLDEYQAFMKNELANVWEDSAPKELGRVRKLANEFVKERKKGH